MLNGKITGERLMSEIEPLVRECHEFYNQTKNDGIYETAVVVGTSDALYEIKGSVSKSDFFASDYAATCKCAYLCSDGKPTVERLLYIYRAVERVKSISLFPISVYNVRTGKIKIYRK